MLWAVGPIPPGSPQKLNRRPDSFESLDARAALPQNCSGMTLILFWSFGNSPTVPALTHKSAMGVWAHGRGWQ